METPCVSADLAPDLSTDRVAWSLVYPQQVQAGPASVEVHSTPHCFQPEKTGLFSQPLRIGESLQEAGARSPPQTCVSCEGRLCPSGLTSSSTFLGNCLCCYQEKEANSILECSHFALHLDKGVI